MILPVAHKKVRLISSLKEQDEKKVNVGPLLRRVLDTDPSQGSVILFAGQPGGGKSTFFAQSIKECPVPCLYVATEEKMEKVGSRVRRVGSVVEYHHAKVTNEARVYKVAKMIRNYRYVVVDSINEVRNDNPDPIISSCRILIKAAQRSKTVVVLIGHVNRDGDIFGPMKTEHLVQRGVRHREGRARRPDDPRREE